MHVNSCMCVSIFFLERSYFDFQEGVNDFKKGKTVADLRQVNVINLRIIYNLKILVKHYRLSKKIWQS